MSTAGTVDRDDLDTDDLDTDDLDTDEIRRVADDLDEDVDEDVDDDDVSAREKLLLDRKELHELGLELDNPEGFADEP